MGRFNLVMGLLFFLVLSLFGQTRTFYEHGHKVEHFTKKDGIPSTHVGGLYQDKKGYLWISSSRNFLKYNGYEFQELELDDELKTFTLEDHLSSVMEGNDGSIWIATLGGGLIRYNAQEKTFKRFKTDKNEENHLSHFYQDSIGNIWSGTIGGVIQLTTGDSLIVHKIKTLEIHLNPYLDSLKKASYKFETITDVPKGEKVEKWIELTEKKIFNVIMNARIDEFYRPVDYGWIENEQGDKIWEMDLSTSLNAGGSFFYNRSIIDTVTLNTGKYKLVFIKAGSEPPNLLSEYVLKSDAILNAEWQGIQLFAYNSQINKRLQEIEQNYQREKGLDFGFDSDIFQDNSGTIWYRGSHFGKIVSDSSGINFQNICSPISTKNICPCEITCLGDKDENHLWVGGRRINNKGAYEIYIGIFDKKTNSFQEIKSGLPHLNFKWFIPFNFNMDKKGNLWIGTIFEGLFKLAPPFYPVGDNNVPLLDHFYFNYPKNFIGQYGNPRNIYQQIIDENNNLWVGTQMGGLYKIDLKKSNFSFKDLSKIVDKSRFLNMVEDENRSVWIGTRANGLIQYDTKKDTIIVYNEQFKTLAIEQPLVPILELPNKKILFRTWKKMIIYDPKIDKIEQIIPTLFPEISDMYVGGSVINDSVIYIPNHHFIDINNWTVLTELSEKIAHTHYRVIFKSSKEGFWLTDNYKDLTKFKINDIKLDTLESYSSETAIYDLLEDSNGGCWVLSRYGLQWFKNEKEQPLSFSKIEGKTINLEGKMLFDTQENIWIFTISGVYKFSRKEQKLERIETFREIDGEQYVFKKKAGTFRVLGTKGLYSFHPDSLQIDNIPPKLVIKYLTYEENNEVQKLINLSSSTPLSFNYSQNDLTIEYVGINFNKSEQITYAYQLKNHQKDWQNVGIDRTARFSNLPSGNYTFKLKAANADGIWSKPTSLKITILPPWWKTWWAYAGYILATVGAAFWYTQSLRKKVKEKQVQLDKELAFNNELTLLNQANQRFVPQDILTILGKESIKDLQLGDQIRTQMTVLFSDIRDYTPLSESMTPEENFKFINSYLGRVGPIIKEHGGFISTYLGDGLMALFVNEPHNAVAATIAIQKELDQYNQIRLGQNRKALKTGMGLNTGELMLGVIGDEHRYESTVISDAVNTASRMEGLTKVFGAAIILSEKTLLGLNVGDTFKVSPIFKPDFAYRYLGKVKVKGKDKALKIYDLYEGETVALRELKAQTKLIFEQGISQYYNREFGKSAESFKQVLLVNESDKAAQYYLDKSVHYIVNGVAEDWSGVEEMVMK